MEIIATTDYFQIETTLQEPEAKKRLGEKVAMRGLFNILPSNLFFGEVHESGFDVKESVWYPHVYNPAFHGSFIEGENGVVVQVRVSNGYATLNAVFGWFAAFGALGLGISMVRDAAYGSAALCVIVGIMFAVLNVLFRRHYVQKVHDGRQKLISVLLPIQRGQALRNKLNKTNTV